VEDLDDECGPNRISNFGKRINLLTAECIEWLKHKTKVECVKTERRKRKKIGCS
jgi:hypothetical protein